MSKSNELNYFKILISIKNQLVIANMLIKSANTYVYKRVELMTLNQIQPTAVKKLKKSIKFNLFTSNGKCKYDSSCSAI